MNQTQSEFEGPATGGASQTPSWLGVTGGVLTMGLGTSVVMWCGWLALHALPEGIRPVASVQAYLLIALEFVGAFVAARAIVRNARGGGAGHGALVGALSAGISAALNLLLLGARLADQSADPNAPSMAQAVGLYLAQALVVGAVAGWAGTLGRAPAAGDRAPETWLAPLAGVTTLSLAPLIVVGGMVTSFRAGLSVPDWPKTYGELMVFYPLSKMVSDNRIFLEHSHRLLGSLAGLCSLALLIYTLRVERRGWVKLWATGQFALVCVQGVLGGVRVTEKSQLLAAVHGYTAQVVLALTAALWVYTSRWYERALPALDAGDSRRKKLAAAALHTLGLQLLLGALYRHLGSPHVLYTHIAVAFAAVLIGFMGGSVNASRPRDPSGLARAQRRLGGAVTALVVVQFGLGWGALVANPPKPADQRSLPPEAHQLGETPAEDAWKGLIRTAHQANGAALLGCAAGLAAVTRRVARRG